MGKAQGSIEYMAIIAVVMGIIAAVAFFTLSPVQPLKAQSQMSLCRQAAIECAGHREAKIDRECPGCLSLCVDESGAPLFENAVICCQKGLHSSIYEGSTDSCTVAPTASFTYDCDRETKFCTFDASGSSDIDGSIVSYMWTVRFGGVLSTEGMSFFPGVTTSGYLRAGANTVTLTVTDDDGLTGTSSQAINMPFEIGHCFSYSLSDDIAGCNADADCQWCSSPRDVRMMPGCMDNEAYQTSCMYCGNGIIEAGIGEVCDSREMNPHGKTCSDFDGYPGAGWVYCAHDCQSFDLSNCIREPVCGDGVRHFTEECDITIRGPEGMCDFNAQGCVNCECVDCADYTSIFSCPSSSCKWCGYGLGGSCIGKDGSC